MYHKQVMKLSLNEDNQECHRYIQRVCYVDTNCILCKKNKYLFPLTKFPKMHPFQDLNL